MDLITVEEFHALLSAVFPVSGGAFELTFGEPPVIESSEGFLVTRLVLTRWTLDETGQRREVAERWPRKMIALGPEARELDRPLEPYVRAWAAQVADVLTRGRISEYEADEVMNVEVLSWARNHTLEAFEAMVRERFEPLLPAPPPPPPPVSEFPETSPEWLDGLLGGLFPVRSPDERCELLYVKAHEYIQDAYGRDASLRAIMQFLVYDAETHEIRDVKEQEVSLLTPEQRRDPERAAAFLTAWARLLPELLARVVEPETLMPYDFFPYKVLRQVRPRTEEDFARALYRHWKLGAPVGNP